MTEMPDKDCGDKLRYYVALLRRWGVPNWKSFIIIFFFILHNIMVSLKIANVLYLLKEI